MSDVKEAAEMVVALQSEYEEHECSDEGVLILERAASAGLKVARAYLAETDPTPVDEAWLKSRGWYQLDGRTMWDHQEIYFGLLHHRKGWDVCAVEGCVGQIRTRGDYLTLCRALGVELKEST